MLYIIQYIFFLTYKKNFKFFIKRKLLKLKSQSEICFNIKSG